MESATGGAAHWPLPPYGQKIDVTVVNMLNLRNKAEKRVHDLLDQKFKLFSGVFGASASVLGVIESGIDFERKVVEAVQRGRDALRRLCEADKLYADDIDTLLTICKSASNGEPLTADHVRDPAAGAAAVTLKRLHSIQHVNALVANERLTFDKIGVTVIYGNNGSGKSGYARVLKKICRARSKGESIHPNIYDANPGVPTASIDFAINGQNKSIAWTLGQPSDPVLSAVSVFDSRTANVHVDQTNDIAYTPLPLKILAALAQASQEIKNRLTAEITAIQKPTPEAIRKPACQAGTGVGKLIAGLSGASQPDTVETLAALTDADRAHLDKLNGDLAADPARIARQLLALKAKGDGFITRLDALAKAVVDETAQALRTPRLKCMKPLGSLRKPPQWCCSPMNHCRTLVLTFGARSGRLRAPVHSAKPIPTSHFQ